MLFAGIKGSAYAVLIEGKALLAKETGEEKGQG